jgi:nucleoside-diphosphate-sugar epimerase
MKKILLIGGGGYIGSYFNLKTSKKYEITNVDINWFSEKKNSIDLKNLSNEFIHKFDVIILLAGHSSVKMCDNDMVSSFKNNVDNFVNLISKIKKNQKFIYASSSSVYGHTNNKIVNEDYDTFVPNNYYDLTKQVIDMYASTTKIDYYGLRFGTVNGWSPNLRVDIMINSMVNSAISEGHIKLYIKDIMRPILGINDLISALQVIIDTDNSISGIYNLASFNSTSEEIANTISSVMNIPVIEYDVNDIEKITNVKLQTKAYNFAINSSKFENNFNFKFTEDIESITKSIINKYSDCEKTNRNKVKKYE